MSAQQSWHVVGHDAGTGDEVEYWIAGGEFTDGPVGGAEQLGGWTLPGLVDAHCHVGYSPEGVVDLPTAEQQARNDLATGVLAIRDCGSPLDTRPLVGRDDLPVLIRAGRHLARPKRYIRGLGVDLEDPAELPAEVARQVRYGGGWIKLVGDWIDRGIGDLAPLWPADGLREAIDIAPAGGARVTAHVFAEDAIPDLLAAGIDCLEHGTGLTDDTVAEVVQRGVHVVPTLVNVDNFPMFADAAEKYPAYAKHMRDLHERRDETFAALIEAGVQVHAGTDAGGYVEHGRIVDELQAMAIAGGGVLGMRGTLLAASTAAREWLELPLPAAGTSADLVIYPRDPAVDPSALHEPVVIRAGRRIDGSPRP
ncbi:MAG: amidohydrolase family protein [Nakamurella sp.]